MANTSILNLNEDIMRLEIPALYRGQFERTLMLASEGAPYFRGRFLNFNIEEFRKDVDITKGKNYGRSEDVIVQFVANAYVGIVEGG